jgi:ABC-type multidrug transport system fused ATPase/permease subunit
MDSETERLLQNVLETASSNRTTVLIAHRLATIRSADRIIVLHKGNLIEMGSHETLMKKEGLYARLYRYQRSQEVARTEVVATSPPEISPFHDSSM